MEIAVSSRISGGAERVRIERVIATGRAFLAVAGLLAIYLDPTEPRRLQATSYSVLTLYAIYGLAVMFWMRGRLNLRPSQVYTFHAIDILCASVLTFVSEGPVSPFFLFFLFVVLAAAFRWAFRETLLTAVVVAVIFLVEMAIAAIGPWRDLFVSSEGEMNRILLREAWLLITGVLLSFLADQDKSARAELAAIANVARQPRIAAGLRNALEALGRNLLSVYRAHSVIIVFKDSDTLRGVRWTITADDTRAGDDDDDDYSLDAIERDAWLFDDGGGAWHASIPGHGEPVVRASVPGSWPLQKRAVRLPPEVLSKAVGGRTPTALIACSFGLAGEWSARIFVVGPERKLSGERAVHLLESLIDHATPGITNVFLMRRLRQRAGADERARVSRELHDGAIQALYGLDMKIEALRRQNRIDADADATLAEVQYGVRHEVQELRDLMQALRPIEIEDAQQLQEVVSGLVERFRRDTGISARFVASESRVVLPPATAIELVRIIQEALVNVRKHSRGKNVLVRIDARDTGGCLVTIEDDGQGFDFEGRVTGLEMDQRRIGPAIIRERARVAKAVLAIESTRGHGSRLELIFGVSS